jgi:hypothetical protein
MTTRLTMAVVLLLALLAQAWGLVSVWRDDPLQNLAVSGKKETQTAIMPGGKQSLQPPQPAIPPDFNQGYIFNAERSLVDGGGKDGKAQSAANVAIDKIHYSGSIITGTNPRALLSYALGGQPDASGSGAQKQGFLRVTLGDTVNGYKVTEILPEKITFSRDGQKITKLLYDKAKDRGQAPIPLAGREQSGQIPAASLAPQAPGQNAPLVLAPSPGGPVVKGAQPPRPATPRKQYTPPPSDEELRRSPLRKRPEPPPS